MRDKKVRVIITLAIYITAIILVAAVIWRVAFFTPASQFQAEHHQRHSPFESFVESAEDANQPKMSLNDVIRAARTWRPAFTSWFGQKAPDFTITDIDGKQHKLSDYHGKDVLIIFWATWCGPCIMEVPHLIALRNTLSEDKLAMLAVSYISTLPPETTKKVKDFVKQNKINYTVFSVDAGDMPAPYNQVSSIPCSFFIDSEGKIKLATEGLLSLGGIKAILRAE